MSQFKVLFTRALAAMVMMTTAGTTQAQSTTAVPLHRRQAGILVADLSQDRIVLLRDLNNDADAEDAGEATSFVDNTNATGFLTTAVFSLFQAVDGTVYFGDGDASAVYAAKDLNLDGDANDAGELRIFFSSLNANGFTLPTPNGLAGDGTYLYVINAGAGTATPQDAIYRLRDINSSGDANDDLADSSIYADFQAIIGSNIASPFDIAFNPTQNALFHADNRDTATPDRIYRSQDINNNGTIEATEITDFHTTGSFGGTSGFVQTVITDGVSIYTHDRTGSISPQKVARLTDLDNSQRIDVANEVTVIWDETNLPAGVTMGTSQGISIGFGQLAIGSSGTGNNVILVATDNDNDGLFSDPGETVAFARNAGFPASARQVLFYAWPCQADFNNAGGVTIQDIFDFLNAWFAGSRAADFNGGGLSVQDIFDFLNAWFAGCV